MHPFFPGHSLSSMLLLAAMFFSLFVSALPSLADESCGPLVQNKCLDCHFETRICQKMQKKKGKSSWKRTIKAMIRHGTQLTKGEQKTLIQCFTSRDTSILTLCNIDR